MKATAEFGSKWSWGGFFLGPIWYFFHGLFLEGLIIAAVIIVSAIFLGGFGLLVGLGSAFYCGGGFFHDAKKHIIKEGKVVAGETKKCPDCAETVKAEARKCRFCGYQFLRKQEKYMCSECETPV